jgi:hypothetical protein
MGAEVELERCGVLSNRREGLVASGLGTSVLLRYSLYLLYWYKSTNTDT